MAACGGYDLNFVKPSPKHLECPVCLLVLKEPHVISCCGNHFCRVCIQRVLLTKKPCPLCQDPDFNIMLHKGVMREVNALGVWCPQKKAGCSWEGELGKVEEHINPKSTKDGKACGYVNVDCRYHCGRVLQRRFIGKHEEEDCQSRPIEVQISSGLKRIKGVISDNQNLQQEVAELKERLSLVMKENEGLKNRVVKLETSQKQCRVSIQELNQQSSASNRELQVIKEEMRILKQGLGSRRIHHREQIDPLAVVMVENLKEKRILKSEKVEEAMKAIDRKHYTRQNHYVDSPQSIGYNATISAPHMHAHTLELLKDVLRDGAAALDVGSGSGYLTACMAFMTAPSGYAVGIDRVAELTSQSIKCIQNDNPDLLRFNLFMVTGDGRDGYAAKAPYDVIHVGGATPAVPQALYNQLKPGGRMIVPVGPKNENQYLEQHEKLRDGTIVKKQLMGVRYGPLV